ncbi:MAG: gamma-glutamyltransferase [Planctomycetes bacterium]|nr:gamma-glutamyltransferase [Planctomycetota bacterium]
MKHIRALSVLIAFTLTSCTYHATGTIQVDKDAAREVREAIDDVLRAFPRARMRDREDDALTSQDVYSVGQSDLEGAAGNAATYRPAAWGEIASKAMVSTAHPLATQAGLAILRAGGNAIDAAAAVQFALNVVEPQSSGIGGGSFLLYYDAASGKVQAYDGRETATSGMDPRCFLDEDGKPLPYYPTRITGGRGVGVPGTLALFDEVLAQHGTMGLADVLQPAIILAERGHPISNRVALALESQKERLSKYREVVRTFFYDERHPFAPGEIAFQCDLAKTFRLLAERGADEFYEGRLASIIADTVRRDRIARGTMTRDDLSAYRVIEREPVESDYRGYSVYGMPPPSTGGATLALILEYIERVAGGTIDAYDPQVAHAISECEALAFSDRALLSDDGFSDVPWRSLLGESQIEHRLSLMNRERATGEAIPVPTLAGIDEDAFRLPDEADDLARSCTTHFVVVDAAGNMVSCTSSIEFEFGSGIMVPGYGFFLNNELTDFDADPGTDEKPALNRVDSEEREIHPGVFSRKRPRSSMSPTIVLKDGKPFLVVGCAGGSRIIPAVAFVLVNVISGGKSLPEAIAAPRYMNRQGRSGATEVEFPLSLGFGSSFASALKDLGHDEALLSPARWKDVLGGVHGAMILPDGRRIGTADPRREGRALGLD